MFPKFDAPKTHHYMDFDFSTFNHSLIVLVVQ